MSFRGWIGTPIVAFHLLVLLAGPTSLSAQLASAGGATPAPASFAASYDELFDALLQMAPAPGRVATVSNLTLQRDAARFTLQSGSVYLLSPVGGRTVGAVFRGKGTFSFVPPTPIEKDRLRRFEKADSLESPFTELVLFFADGTVPELEGAATFGPGPVPGDLRGAVKESLKFLSEEDNRTFEPDLMSAFLNGERSPLFYAHIKRSGGGPLMFMLNPYELEGVRLQGKAVRRSWERRSEVITQFPVRGMSPGTRVRRERLRQADVRSYVIESELLPTATGELSFKAAATLEIVSDTAVGPWVVFELFEKLKVDSAR